MFSRVVVAIIMYNTFASTADDLIGDSETLYLTDSDQCRATHNIDQAMRTKGLKYINEV